MPDAKDSAATTPQPELRKLIAENEALREQLRRSQRLATVGTMMAMVAHEFNNILTPIINYAQMARSNPTLTEKAISRAADGGLRATSICRALLGMTRGEGDGPEFVCVNELVTETLEAMAREPKKDRIELHVDVPETLIILTNRIELQQILLNLLINARAAVLPKPGVRRISVSARGDHTYLKVQVSDTGVGIPPENLQLIFEPFYTTRQSEEGETRGHGLGLAICREIIEEMAGKINVHSVVDEGTTFSVTLPAATIEKP
ncbi:MAG: sensor histidine kinase [Phycisphaerae bacterium]